MAIAAHAPTRKRPAAHAIRATIGLAGVLGLAAAAAFSPEFVVTRVRPGANLGPEQHALIAGVRWAALATGALLVALAAALPALLGRRRYDDLSGAHLAGFAVFLAPLAVTALALAVKVALGPVHPAYMAAMAEDAPVQNLTSLAYLVAAALAVVAAVRFLRAGERLPGGLYALLALALLFIGLEEVSWGQRAFGVETPEWFRAHNTQDEISLHNLEPFQRILHTCYVAVGLYGALAWLAPAVIADPGLRRLARHVAPPWFLAPYFAVVTAFYLVYDYTSRWSFFVARDQELPELLLSIGFLLFVVTVLHRQKAAQRPG